jgi:hypothetical protein
LSLLRNLLFVDNGKTHKRADVIETVLFLYEDTALVSLFLVSFNIAIMSFTSNISILKNINQKYRIDSMSVQRRIVIISIENEIEIDDERRFKEETY